MATRFNIHKLGVNDTKSLRAAFEKLNKDSTHLDHLLDYYAALESIESPCSHEKQLLCLSAEMLHANGSKQDNLTIARESLLDSIRDAAKQAKDFANTLVFNIRSSKGRVTKLKVMHHEVAKASGHESVQMQLKALGVLRTSSSVVTNTSELKSRMKKFSTNVNTCLDIFDRLEKQVQTDFKKTALALKDKPQAIELHLKASLVDTFTEELPSKMKAVVSDVGNTVKEGYRINQYYSTLCGHTLHVKYAKRYTNLSKQKLISSQALAEYLDSLRIDYEMLEALDKQITVDVKLTDVLDLLDMSEELIDKIEKYNDSRKPFYTVYESLQISGLFNEDSQEASDAISITKNINQIVHSDIPAIVDSYSKILHSMLTSCYSMLLSSEWYEQKNI